MAGQLMTPRGRVPRSSLSPICAGSRADSSAFLLNMTRLRDNGASMRVISSNESKSCLLIGGKLSTHARFSAMIDRQSVRYCTFLAHIHSFATVAFASSPIEQEETKGKGQRCRYSCKQSGFTKRLQSKRSG